MVKWIVVEVLALLGALAGASAMAARMGTADPFDKLVEFVDVITHAPQQLCTLPVIQQLNRHTHTRKWRAQFMRGTGEHRGLGLYESFDPRTSGIEAARKLRNLIAALNLNARTEITSSELFYTYA